MKINDLITHRELGTGTIIKLSEPTISLPYQIATVYLLNGQTEELATTILFPLKLKKS